MQKNITENVGSFSATTFFGSAAAWCTVLLSQLAILASAHPSRPASSGSTLLVLGHRLLPLEDPLPLKVVKAPPPRSMTPHRATG